MITRAGSVAMLLHGEGWDELIMIAVGLALAFVVISFTGRRTTTPADGEEDVATNDTRDQAP